MGGFRFNKNQKLQIQRGFRFTSQILVLVTAILTPIVEFGLTKNTVVKIIIYSVLVISALGSSLPLILGQIPERKRAINLRRLIIIALDTACLTLNFQHRAKYRACIFTMGKKDSNVLSIQYNSSNMDDAVDVDIKLEKLQGCTGHAWAEDQPVVADLTIAEQDGAATWGLTDEQKTMTEKLKAVLSIPICYPTNHRKIGILSFDSEEPVADFFYEQHTQEIGAEFAGQFAILLEETGKITYL